MGAAPTLPTTADGEVTLTAAQAAALTAYHAEVAKLLDIVADVLADVHVTYDTMVPNDATLAVGSIGRVRIADLRRLGRKAANIRRLVGRPPAITGTRIVTLAYTDPTEEGRPS